MKRASTISNIDCVMPQVNSRWRCSNRCEAAKRWVEYPDHIFVDRIDIQIEIVPVPFDKISDQRQGESSNLIRQRVIKARQIQERRYTEYTGIYCNAQMNSKLLAMYAQPDAKGLALLKNAMERLNLSARAYDRILKVARTIADLEGAEQILPNHLAEAISYRNLDRENWAG
jgi:magnesium chelatase family protein